MKKNVVRICIFICILISVLSCASIPKVTQANLIQSEQHMMWELRGTNGSIIYILGTFHLANEDLSPLGDEVIALFDSADRIVGEISTEDWGNYQQVLINNLVQSIPITNNQYKDITQYLTKEESALLTELLGENTMNSLKLYEPWVITSTLSTALYAALGFNAEQGVDIQLITRATQTNRHMEGLDAIQTQMDAMRYGTYEQQLVILQNTLQLLTELENSDETEIMMTMYEAYKDGDHDALALIMQKEKELEMEEQSDYAVGYYKLLMDDRNAAWAEKFHEYLEMGGITFIFAGSGHFVGENNVFDIMREKGYIVN